jgi:transposase
MNSTQVAVDLAKSVFQVAVSSTPGRIDEQHRLSRAGFGRFFAAHEPVEVLMEACGSAHHWGRELTALGHTVSLLPPADVRRYRNGDKTDRADTKAILEAARNEAIDPVPVKTLDQQAIAALHRLRSGYLATRTARINCVRGLLREFGVAIPVGARHLAPRARAAIDDGTVPEPALLDASPRPSLVSRYGMSTPENSMRIRGLTTMRPSITSGGSTPYVVMSSGTSPVIRTPAPAGVSEMGNLTV